jgi:asparagine synthase (glutamine-hydrolysing)
MCGIAGILNLKEQKPLGLDSLESMASVLNHRGPDESGLYIDDYVALAHTRLSIFGLKDGIQPIHNENKNLWIIYNGEIFNFPELKKDLISRGHSFYTSTDTEVIIHLFEEKGEECLNYLNGQFVFAIWNSDNREIFIARDRIGIRPLHYTFYNNQFIFGSEIKSIFSFDHIPRKIDPLMLDQVFTFWTTLPGKTIFENIFELPPGHFIKISPEGIKLKKFWELKFYPPDELFTYSTNEAAEAINELLLDSIKIRLRADVLVGSYLSGGLDSSGITSLISKNFNNDLRTFGITFEEKTFDESDYQRQMVSYLGTKHSEVRALNNQIYSSFEDVIWHCEKPILRTAPVPLYILSKVVHESGYKVVLTGEGADEIFGGYDIFKEAKIRNFWAKQPDSQLRPLLLSKLYPDILSDPKLVPTLKSFFGVGLNNSADPLFSHLIRWNNTSRLKTFFSNEVKEQTNNYNCLEDLREILPDQFTKWDPLSKAQYLEIIIFLSNYLLSSQGDRVAMANSVEIRLPYLDYRVIEFMSKIPENLKLNGLNEKFLLKKIYKNVLPDNIIRRAKHPYRAPIKQSLLKYFTNSGKTKKLNGIISSSLFDKVKVEKLVNKLERFEHVSEWDNMALTGIISTEIINDRFIENFNIKNLKSFRFNVIFDKRKIKNSVLV